MHGVELEQRGELAGELMPAARVAVLQIVPHLGHAGQEVHERPHQRVAGEHRPLGRIRQELRESLVRESFRREEPDVGADAQARGQFEPQPAAHALALHHDGLGDERRGGRLAQNVCQVVGEDFQPVAGMGEELRHRAFDGVAAPGVRRGRGLIPP
jgi:hypothetical protein